MVEPRLPIMPDWLFAGIAFSALTMHIPTCWLSSGHTLWSGSTEWRNDLIMINGLVWLALLGLQFQQYLGEVSIPTCALGCILYVFGFTVVGDWICCLPLWFKKQGRTINFSLSFEVFCWRASHRLQRASYHPNLSLLKIYGPGWGDRIIWKPFRVQ